MTVQDHNAKHLNETKLSTLKNTPERLPLRPFLLLSREYAHLLYWQHWEGKKKKC